MNEKELIKRQAVDFAFWLVNSPKKEYYSISWILIKYKQFLKEEKSLETKK